MRDRCCCTTALAVGDICASFALSLALVMLLMVFLWPVFFVLVWRPYKLREVDARRKESFRHLAQLTGRPFDEAAYQQVVPAHVAEHLHLRLPHQGLPDAPRDPEEERLSDELDYQGRHPDEASGRQKRLARLLEEYAALEASQE